MFKIGVFKNKYLWYAILASFALQLLISLRPGLQTVFDIQSPEPIDWAIALLLAGIVFSAIELGKYIASNRRKS